MVVLLEGSPISTEELELCQSDHWVLGHLPDQVPSPRLLSLAGRPSLGIVLVVPNLFHLRMMEATVFLGTFNDADIFGTLPQICASTQSSRNSTDNSFDLMAFALTCTVNFGTLYSLLCAFPCPLNCIYHRWTPIKLQKHLKDDQWKHDAPELNFDSHSKGSEYFCYFFCVIYIYIFIFKLLVLFTPFSPQFHDIQLVVTVLSHRCYSSTDSGEAYWATMCRLMRKTLNLINFRITKCIKREGV